jgi:hypothetical protein
MDAHFATTPAEAENLLLASSATRKEDARPMPHTIICADCGDERRNAQYANTKFCERCRLLRNLVFVGPRTRTCALGGCKTKFAPVGRGDEHCAEHAFGANTQGRCVVCEQDDQPLHRASLQICMACLRNPAKRHFIVNALRVHQRRRRGGSS